MIKLKSLVYQVVAVGKRQSGKSFWLRRKMWRDAQATGGYLLAHDPEGGFSEDRSIPSRRYSSPAAAAQGIAQLGGRVAHILDFGGGELADMDDDDDDDTSDGPDQALRFALTLARASRARAVGGKYAPVYLLIDEAVDADSLDAHRMSRMWKRTIMKARHRGIGLGVTMQTLYLAHRTVTMQASQIEVFALVDDADIERLMKVGLDKALVGKLRTMPEREHITIQNGRTVAVNDRAWTHGATVGESPKRRRLSGA